VKASTLGATADLELYASDGTTLLGSGTTAASLSSVIRKYVDPTTDGVPETYYARVSCSGGSYVLVVTRSATFDIESNDSSTSPQDLTDFRGVLGNVESGADDYYEIVIPPPAILVPQAISPLCVIADLPAAGPFTFDNPLASGGGSLLRMELYDSGGTLVATGSTDLVLQVARPGSYLLRVFGADDSRGEYVLSLKSCPSVPTSIQPR